MKVGFFNNINFLGQYFLDKLEVSIIKSQKKS